MAYCEGAGIILIISGLRASEVLMNPIRRFLLMLYMMRVALGLLTILGFGLPWAFKKSMFHGVADLTLWQAGEAAFLAALLVNSAITAGYLVLLHGEERAIGWLPEADAP